MKNVTLNNANHALMINVLTGIEDLNVISNDRNQYLIKTLNIDQCNENWNYLHKGKDWECLVKNK